MSFKDVSYLELWQRFCSGQPTICTILVEGILWNYYELGPVVQEEMSFKDISYLKLWGPFRSAEWNNLCKFGRGYYEEQFWGTILNLDQWFRRRCRLKIFLIWSSGGPFVQRSRTVCAILEDGIKGNNSVKLFWIEPVVQEEMSFKRFLIWSSYRCPVWWIGTNCTILKEGIMGSYAIHTLTS